MKKLCKLFILLSLLCSCNKIDPNTELQVYAPDGAPALSLTYLMSEERLGIQDEYHIVESSTISAYVSGENSKADIAILPVNAAVKLLGDGSKYQMLGVVTHGNLYMVSANTFTSLSDLVGKTVGVINLTNVPGFVFKMILNNSSIPFATVGNDGKIDTSKVNLKAIDATQIGTDSSIDYYIAAEPAVSFKVNALKDKGYKVVADLQELYGSSNGYPQAVAVARKTLIEENPKLIKEFMKGLVSNDSYVKESDVNSVIETITSHLSEGQAPTFSAKNLTTTVIENCNISFTESKECKDEVISFMEKFNVVANNAFGTPSEEFFYLG